MKKALTTLGKLLIIFIVTFISIYLLVFIGGWELFESKDPILMEIGVSVIVTFFLFVIGSAMETMQKENKDKIEKLESRIVELESLLKSKD